MVYDIEFIRRVDSQAEASAVQVIQLVADGVAGIIKPAEALYRQSDMIPPPHGFRIRESGGDIVHEPEHA